MRSLLSVLAFCAIFGITGSATAQIYPSHPTTLIVPARAGEPVDVLARILAERMERSIGQPVQIENVDLTDAFRVDRLARAAPDGYMFGISSWNYALYNLKPVALLPSVPAWIVGRKTLPARKLKELTAWLKANSDAARSGVLGSGAPGKASAGFVESRGPGHICELLMQRATGSRIQLVPYYSAESMFRGLLRGQIDFVCDRAANSVAMVRAGLIRAYAVTAKSRWSEMPDIPTTDEMGVPEIYVSYWHGLWAPKGTPDDIIAKLNAAAADAIADSGVRRRLSDQGMEVPPPEDQTPEALGAFQRAELSRYCDAMLTTVIAIIPTCSGRRAGFEAFVERRHTER